MVSEFGLGSDLGSSLGTAQIWNIFCLGGCKELVIAKRTECERTLYASHLKIEPTQVQVYDLILYLETVEDPVIIHRT